jgi:hypothetical protein
MAPIAETSARTDEALLVDKANINDANDDIRAWNAMAGGAETGFHGKGRAEHLAYCGPCPRSTLPSATGPDAAARQAWYPAEW